MVKAFAIIIILFALGAQAESGTSYSRLLSRIQKTYLPKSANYPILIMDRDELEWRFARMKATQKQDEKKRQEIIKKYIQEKTGILVSENSVANFEPYLAVVKDMAVAMPAFDEHADGTQALSLCAVFPPDANRNQRLETERILQLTIDEIYANQGSYGGLRSNLSYEDYLLISILHESSHCMDRFFFPRVYQGDDDPWTLHLSESYAETLALFLMVKEGRADVAKVRAYLRDIYSFFMEPYFISHPENSFGSAAYDYGGLIYHLSPSILAAQHEINTRAEIIKAMSITELQNLAADIVHQNAYPSRSFTALYSSYADGRAVALQRYQDYASQSPDLFAEALAQLQSYIQQEDVFKATAFLTQPLPASDEPVTQLLPLDDSKLCSFLKKDNQMGYLAQVEILRQDLRAGNPSPKAQRDRFNELSNLWSVVGKKCFGEQ